MSNLYIQRLIPLIGTNDDLAQHSSAEPFLEAAGLLFSGCCGSPNTALDHCVDMLNQTPELVVGLNQQQIETFAQEILTFLRIPFTGE